MAQFLTSFNVKLDRQGMKALMAKYDADGDGTIDYYEFLLRVLPECFPEPTAKTQTPA